MHWNVQEPVNSPMGGNYGLDEEGISGAAARARSAASAALDGRKMETIKTKKFASTYGSAMSWDHRYFGGGAWPRDGMVIYDRKTGELFEPETSPNSGPARGEFDPAGNYWAAGRGGSLIKFDITTSAPRISAADPLHLALHRQGRQERRGLGRRAQRRPLSALRSEDRAVHRLHAARALRHGSRAWIDNSTSPVSVWFVDHDGWLVHIQPLD